MATANKTRYAILGVLTVSDSSGYDIKKYCDGILSHFWHENYGHLYPVLRQMLAEGVIELAGQDPSSRKVLYRITTKGRDEFREWLLQPAEYRPARSEFLLKLSFSAGLPAGRTLAMIAEYRKMHEERLEQYLAMEQYLLRDGRASADPHTPFVLAPLKYGIASARAVVGWCDEVTSMLREAE